MNIDIIRTLKALGMSDMEIHRSTTNSQTYNFTAAAGTNVQTLQIPGTASVLLGIIVDIDGAAVTDFFNLKLNNEVLCNQQLQVQVNRLSQAIARNSFFSLFRKMTGNDTLTVDYTSTAGNNVHFTIVYLTNYNRGIAK